MVCNLLSLRGMNDKTFSTAMSQIVREAEAKREQEVRDQQRSLLFGKVRRVFVFLFIATLFVVAFNYHTEVQQVVSEKVFAPPRPKIGSGTGEALKNLQAHAEKRDKVLDEITETTGLK
jgi:hypothetical protein